MDVARGLLAAVAFLGLALSAIGVAAGLLALWAGDRHGALGAAVVAVVASVVCLLLLRALQLSDRA